MIDINIQVNIDDMYRVGDNVLNKNLLKKLSFDNDKLHLLRKAYQEKDIIVDRLNNHVDDVVLTQSLIIKLRDIEYQMQDLWGFPRSFNHHRYTFSLNNCTCQGVEHRIKKCPLHSLLN